MTSNPAGKRILFISGSDFKEKSIQVIRKTPEAYHRAGWDVHYVVGRDTSMNGDYFYEKIFNPEGIKVYRFLVPFAGIHGWSKNAMWMAVWFRIRNIILVLGLFFKARRLTKQTGDFDVLYGYEIPGVLAAALLRKLGYVRNSVFVTRFQGVLHVKEWLRKDQAFRKISNWDALVALRTKADLTIMTNDGSQGLHVLERLRAPKNKTLFLINGVDIPSLVPEKIHQIKEAYYPTPGFHLLSVSRLDAHKRLDRGIRIVEAIVKKHNFRNVRYVIIGAGAEHENLLSLIKKLDLSDYVVLVGPVNHSDVHYHFHLNDFLISMYTSSNVGNPLLEAIRHNKPVVTLNNGDTGDWIRHKWNGLIYDVVDERDLNEGEYSEIAKDIVELFNNPVFLETMKANLKTTEQERLWTWEERFDAELSEIDNLLKNYQC
jgi:glycosyltransferase involved in cell wall biosynthesis